MNERNAMGYALHCAEAVARSQPPATTWDALAEEEQRVYLALVYATFAWLFEPPGRISQYLSREQLRAANVRFREHLKWERRAHPNGGLAQELLEVANLSISHAARLNHVSRMTYHKWLGGAAITAERATRLQDLIESYRAQGFFAPS